MTQKEFETLKEGDEVILQKSGKLNGQKGVIRSIKQNVVAIRMETGILHICSYLKIKKA